jgi:vacuolar iron transporter family protein
MVIFYHRQEHFQGGDTVKDIVIGMSDGLTLPFALAAGISGAISAAHIIVTANVAGPSFGATPSSAL